MHTGDGHAPGLDRALAILDRHDLDVARQLRAWCRVVLGEPASPAPWHHTRLNTRPEPVELSLGCPDGGLRATFDLSGRCATPSERLAQALACIQEAAPRAHVPGGAVATFSALQHDRPLTWGAWLGVRWRADGTVRAKVYVEVPRSMPPDEIDRWLHAWLGRRPPTPPEARLLLVGGTPGDATCECYFECRRGTHAVHWGCWSDWDRLLREAGIDGEAQGVFPLMRRFDGREPRREQAPAAAWIGYSLAGTPDGAIHAAAVLATAARLAGGEAGLRHQVLSLAGRQGDGLPLYDALTAPLRNLHRADGFHNILSCSAAPGAAAGWQMAFCPPHAAASVSQEPS